MLRAFKLYTGPDNASHVLEGTIDKKDRTDVVAIHFKETSAHSSYDWHPPPEKQFVIKCVHRGLRCVLLSRQGKIGR